jgi:hypothetical protein
MIRMLSVLSCVTALTAANVALAQERQPIGSVKTVAGASYLVSAGAKSAAKVGDYVYKNDVMETGKDGAIGVIFKDDTQVSIGGNTELTLDDFVYQPQQEQYAFSSKLAKGTLFMATGAIAKLKPEAVQVTTPTGTLGVRGTRFVLQVAEQ